MLGFLMGLLGAIPYVGGAIEKVTTVVYESRVRIAMSYHGVARDVAVEMLRSSASDNQTRVAILQIFSSTPVLLGLLVAFSIPPVAYEWKVVLVDNIICPVLWGVTCETTAIRGDVMDWMRTVVNWLFGTGIALAIADKAEKLISKAK